MLVGRLHAVGVTPQRAVPRRPGPGRSECRSHISAGTADASGSCQPRIAFEGQPFHIESVEVYTPSMQSSARDSTGGEVVRGLADPAVRAAVIREVEASNVVELAGRTLDLRVPRHRLVWDALVATTLPERRPCEASAVARST